jgi:hypothetical protein
MESIDIIGDHVKFQEIMRPSNHYSSTVYSNNITTSLFNLGSILHAFDSHLISVLSL